MSCSHLPLSESSPPLSRLFVRAIIGRAKETRGDVETDLMSSTSSDVCELWSGEDVVRVIGTPKVLQLVYKWTTSDGSDDGHFDLKAGILNFQDQATKNEFYSAEGQSQASPEPITPIVDSPRNRDIELTEALDSARNTDIDRWLVSNNPPNLSLNLSIRALSGTRMTILIAVGIFVQGAVLALAAVSQYKLHLPKNDASIPNYAFPVFFFGTLILASGVFLCARVVETSTKETTWKPSDPGATRVVWLQQGGQTVGDQMFESFARIHAKGEVKTSHRTKGEAGEMIGRESLTTTAVLVTLLGFTTQFFGLRATHSSVIVLQLAAILVMTALRSYSHSE